MEGLQEGLCFGSVAVGVKQPPVIQSRRTDHVQSSHLSGPVSNHGVVFILDYRGEAMSLSSDDTIFFIIF